MKIFRLSAAVLLLGFLSNTAGAAATVNLENQDYEVSAQPGSTGEEFNVYASRMNVSGVCTVTVTDATTSTENMIRYPIIVADGAVLTLDLSGLTKGAPRFCSGIYCEGSARLIVKGSSEIGVGTQETFCRTCPVFRAPDLTFTAADGTEIEGTVNFFEHAGWAGVDADVAVKINTLSYITVYTSDYYERFADGDVLTVSWWNLAVADPAAVPEGMSFYLDRGRTLAVYPSVPVAGSMYAKQTSGWSFPFDVVLDHEEARFRVASRYFGTVSGDITGAGALEIRHSVSGSYLDDNVPALNGMRFTGEVNVAGALKFGDAGAVARFENGASFAGCTGSAAGIRELVVSGTESVVAGLSSDASVSCTGGDDSLTVVADKTEEPEIIPNGATVVLKDDLVDPVLSRASLWFDASVESSFQQFKLNGTLQSVDDGGTDCIVVDMWRDRRGGKSIVLYQSHTLVAYVAPYLLPSAQNGLSVLNFSRPDADRPVRMGFCTTSALGSSVPQTPKLVVMVFGSHYGGGYALFGNNDGTFVRKNGIENPILPETATKCRLWLDGKQADDPTKAYFDGGWQVISFDPAGAEIKGLGMSVETYSATTCGKQRFGEILMFDEDLSDAERYAVERYLAVKWGLLDKFAVSADNGVKARVQGAGTVSLETDAVVGGAFAGTLELNGNALRLTPAAPDEDEIARIDGRIGWFDPSYAPSVELHTDGVGCVHVNDRVLGAAEGAFTVFGNSRRCNMGSGEHEGWLDFRRGTGDYINNGRLMRIKKYPHDSENAPDQMDVRTLIMAEDSSAGGGTPFLSGTSGSKQGVYQRYLSGNPYGYTDGSWRDPIWSTNTLAAYRSGSSVYVDGVPTDAEVRGFNARKEVYSTVFNDAAFPLMAFGDIYGNVCTNAAGEMTGEILGEMLMYDRVLTDEERGKVEAYLMGKWCGRSPAGYGDWSAATVTGAGSVDVPAGASFPKFDAGFTGTAVFGAEEIVFRIDRESRTVANAIVSENGTLSFAETVSVSVSPAKLDVGTYRLVSGEIAPGTEWVLDVHDATGRMKGAKLLVTATSVDLVVPVKGLVLHVL